MPGAVDLTFGDAGLLAQNWYTSTLEAPPLAIEPDSRIRLSSRGQPGVTGVGRLFESGEFDAAGFLPLPWATALKPVAISLKSGVLYVTSTGIVANGTRASAIARASNGVLDSTFGTAGWVSLSLPPRNVPFGGSWPGASAHVVAGGHVHLLLPFVSNTIDRSAFGVMRLDLSGALDATFNTNGVSIIDVGAQPLSNTRHLAVDANGRIYVGATGALGRSVVFRLTTTGALDSTFGTNGLVDLTFERLVALALDDRGGVVLAGGSGTQAAVARLTLDGALDMTFGVQGIAKARFDQPSRAAGCVLTPSGDIVLSAVVGPISGNEDLGLVRLTSSGAIDSTFGAAGHVTLPRLRHRSPLEGGLAFDPAGRVVVVSLSDGATPERWYERFWL